MSKEDLKVEPKQTDDFKDKYYALLEENNKINNDLKNIKEEHKKLQKEFNDNKSLFEKENQKLKIENEIKSDLLLKSGQSPAKSNEIEDKKSLKDLILNRN